jgi:hypothetical protein
VTYILTIYGVDSGGNIMPPIVETGVELHEVETVIDMICAMNDIKDVDTVMMAKEVVE